MAKNKKPSQPPKTARQDEPATPTTMAAMDRAFTEEELESARNQGRAALGEGIDQNKIPTLDALEPVMVDPSGSDAADDVTFAAEPDTKLEKGPPKFKEVIQNHRFVGYATQFMSDGLKFENVILQAGAKFMNTDRDNPNDLDLPPGKYNVWCLGQVIYAENAK